MTSLTIHLPDELAEEAKRKGLLDPVQITALIKQAVAQAQHDVPNQNRFKLGLMSNQNVWISDDFDAPLDEHFKSLEP